jgi:hypothetical protein
MSTMQITNEPTQIRFVRPPRHRGERDYARDTLDWVEQTLKGHVPKRDGLHRESPYAHIRYQVTEK